MERYAIISEKQKQIWEFQALSLSRNYEPSSEIRNHLNFEVVCHSTLKAAADDTAVDGFEKSLAMFGSRQASRTKS